MTSIRGLLQLYSNDKKISELVRQSATDDVPSEEASKYFHLMLTPEIRELNNQYALKAIENTNAVYNPLISLQEKDSLVYLTKRSPEIPMIGLHFNQFVESIMKESDSDTDDKSIKKSVVDFKVSGEEIDSQAIIPYEGDSKELGVCTSLMQYYIYGLAKREQLPLLMRASFGFPHATIIECNTALRLTIGALENPEILSKYVKILKQLPLEMALSVKNEDAKSKIKKFLEYEECKEHLKRLKPLIMREFEKGKASLINFITIALDVFSENPEPTTETDSNQDDSDEVNDKKHTPIAGHNFTATAAVNDTAAAAPKPPANPTNNKPGGI